MKNRIYIIILAVLSMSFLNVQAQENTLKEKWPALNGHKFLSSNMLRSSFITTHLQADIGLGSTSALKINGIMIDEHEILSFEGKIMFFDMKVRYQQRFTPWLALYMSYKMSGRLGSDMSTILADGVNTLSGTDIGWLIRLKQSDKYKLAASIGLNNITGNFVNVKQYISEVVNGEPYPSVIKKVPAMSVVAGLRTAYAFNSTFGLQFQADYAYGETLERAVSGGYFSGGILGDVDFFPKHDLPLGLALGYTISYSPEIVMSDGGTANMFTGKIAYTGSDDFELGFQYVYYNTKLKSVNSSPFISKAVLNLKFYL